MTSRHTPHEPRVRRRRASRWPLSAHRPVGAGVQSAPTGFDFGAAARGGLPAVQRPIRATGQGARGPTRNAVPAPDDRGDGR